MAVIVFFPVLIFAVLILATFRPVQRKEVAWFATQHRLELTPANGGHVIDYLTRTRRWRFFGAVGAVASAIAINMVIADDQGGFNTFVILFAGWFAGGILAELPVGRGSRQGRRSALLVERRLISYVSLIARRLLVIAIAVGLLSVSLRLFASPQPQASLQSWRDIIELGALSIVIAVVAVLGIHNVVRRPQPAVQADVLAADTAVRTAAVTRICAGWIVLQFIIDLALLTLNADQSAINWIAGLLIPVGLIGIILGWAFVPTRIVTTSASPSPTGSPMAAG